MRLERYFGCGDKLNAVLEEDGRVVVVPLYVRYKVVLLVWVNEQGGDCETNEAQSTWK